MTKQPTVENVVIIGSGPAGLTAGIYAARANLNPLIIDGDTPGGQLMGTTMVENWPGEQEILGPTLMKKMRDHAAHLGCRFLAEKITTISLSKKPFILTTSKDKTLQTRAVIIASGATPKRLGCPGEETYWGKGVTTCTVCDGAFYQDKPVIIVGGGDTAMEDALFMTKFTKKIIIVQKKKHLTASKAMQKKVLSKKSIKIIYESTVTRIEGDDEHVQKATITNLVTKEKITALTNAVFIAVGLTPNTGLFRGQFELTKLGHIICPEHTKTSVDGVFAAGDVADERYRQAITSAGSGCAAALDVERYLQMVR